MSPIQPQYLLFTSLVKHGEMLRYLLAAKVRKSLMEPYGFHRQLNSAALTGNPDRVFEFYYVEDPSQALGQLETLSEDPTFGECHRLIEDTRIHSRLTEDERITGSKRAPRSKFTSPPRQMSLMDVPPPLQKLIQMDYQFELKSRQACARSLAQAPHLLQTTCTLHSNDKLDEFKNYMSALLHTFADSGLSLLIAGQHVGRIELAPATGTPVVETDFTPTKDPISILNVWEFEDLDSPKLLMSRLAENPTYSKLDKLCTQDQHICRNISRYYQSYPLLAGTPQTL